MFNYASQMNPGMGGFALAGGMGPTFGFPMAGMRLGMNPPSMMAGSAMLGNMPAVAVQNQMQDTIFMALLGIIMQLMLNQSSQGQQQACNGGGSQAYSPSPGSTGYSGNSGGSSGYSGGSTPPNLSANQQQQAQNINQFLQSKGSPAAGQDAGQLAVKYGQMYQVDPRILISIAGQETQFGKTGVGVRGMLGVGAYDNDPNNSTRNATFSGVEQQLKVGAQTFAKLRAKGGSGPNDPIEKQIQAVGNAGWASDKGWASGVTNMFHQISGKIS